MLYKLVDYFKLFLFLVMKETWKMEEIIQISLSVTLRATIYFLNDDITF